MNKTELKNFAVNARRELLKQVRLRASLFGITEKTDLKMLEEFGQITINGNSYPAFMKSSFKSLQKQLKQKGFEQVIEEVAYTWFNRIIAIRYMEVHDYLPERVNVLSSSTGRIDPDILNDYLTMELPIDVEKVEGLLSKGDTEGAYRLLFIAQCNALYEILPFMFEKIQDYTELLLPDFLLDSESVINKLIKEVSKENYMDEKGKANVEILGWLYQYYMSEKKDEVGGLKNSAVKKEDLSVVTQLFTPSWIVEYMVQNTLGKMYDVKYPNNAISSSWEYYLNSTEYQNINPDFQRIEDIKVLDPACGSGHILVYAFDILYNMYEEQGYQRRDIPNLIIEHNLYGLEIDKRSSQIANFVLIMKATEKQKRFLKTTREISTNIIEIVDADIDIDINVLKYIAENDEEINHFYEINSLYNNAKQYGSLLKPFKYSLKSWSNRIEKLRKEELDLIERTYLEVLIEKVLPILKQNELLSHKYTAVVTNPPYHNKYNPLLKKYIHSNYSDYKSDLYSAFMIKALDMTIENGYSGFMTPFTWMFIASHEKLRHYIIDSKNISSLVQLEYSAFEDATVPLCTLVVQNQNVNKSGIYIRLSELKGNQSSHLKLAAKKDVQYKYISNTNTFSKIPGIPIAYWLTEKLVKPFENKNIGSISVSKAGIVSGEDNYFLKLWFEVELSKITFEAETFENPNKFKWVPINKGGPFRKYYGNYEYVIKLDELWDSEKTNVSVRRGDSNFYFKNGITWSYVTSGAPSFRVSRNKVFATAAPSIYLKREDDIKYTLAFLNSNIAKFYLNLLNPTINLNVTNISDLPLIVDSAKKTKVENYTQANLNISTRDWDFFETSWNFKTHPFIEFNSSEKIENRFLEWSEFTEKQFREMKLNEEELNKIFLSIYDLNTEISSKVYDKDIKIYRANLYNDARSFLSYFIGCILGRYSLEVEGIAYAGGMWDDSKYSSFLPNKYGLIQFTDVEYFEHDIIARLREFLARVFSEVSIEENMHWLAEALEMKKGESTEERLRRYFMDEFFIDHCKSYQKRPIYWLVDSGKQKGLRTLIYMHRYQSDTMATIRFEHLQEIQAKYNHEIDAIDTRLVNLNLSATERQNLDRQKIVFKKRLEELIEFDKKLAGYANAQITIDLDNGVMKNYTKFEGVLKKIK